MIHFFDSEVAKEYGVHAAVILQNLAHWVKHNEANGVNYYDGNYWTYNSKKAFSELFPYLTERQISTALQKLIDGGVVITGNYNKSAYDRTLWYALTEKGKCILHFCKMENTGMQNGFDGIVEPIPDINTNNNPNPKHRVRAASRFSPPTIEAVRAYCAERGNSVDAQRFVDYYTANGWRVGRNPMKDWKATVRTWERNGYSGGNQQRQAAPQQQAAEIPEGWAEYAALIAAAENGV